MDPNPSRAKERIEEAVARVASSSRAFAGRARSQANVSLRELIDPEGEAIASLVDVERAPGAASLALPMDLITFETWLLGHLGDRDELDLDVNTHRDLWFSFGAWIAETLRDRHGGFWLIGNEDPRTWRMGFSKILVEIAPHAFAEKLLRSGQGCGRRLLGEIERIRGLHEQAAAAEGGKARDRYGPSHYARMHTVPLAQWMALDLARLRSAWTEKSAVELKELVGSAAKRLPAQNAPIVEKITEMLSQLEPSRPCGEQVNERPLFEAVAQILAMKRATAPLAVDMLEKVVLPALHVGTPDKFPPLGADDVMNIRKGVELFAVYVDVVPYAHPAEEGGFLGTFSPKDISTPYPDRGNLEIGRGDWVVVNPGRIRPQIDRFDPKRMLAAYDRFLRYAQEQPNVPRLRETGRPLAEMTAKALQDLRACVFAAAETGSALVFRLLPPPP